MADTSAYLSFDRDECSVLLEALERHAAALRYDPYYTRQRDALNLDTANDCDVFVGRIVEFLRGDA